ncbi:hypothetical protein D3C72_1991730 [compost metagenome]
MARNSSVLPSSGFGAAAEDSLVSVSHATPSSEMAMPYQARRPSRSRRNSSAPSAASTGSVAVINPACEALVYSSACASNRKYRHGSHRPSSRIHFQSPAR